MHVKSFSRWGKGTRHASEHDTLCHGPTSEQNRKREWRREAEEKIQNGSDKWANMWGNSRMRMKHVQTVTPPYMFVAFHFFVAVFMSRKNRFWWQLAKHAKQRRMDRLLIQHCCSKTNLKMLSIQKKKHHASSCFTLCKRLTGFHGILFWTLLR